MMDGRYRDAVEEWRSHLGPAGIITDPGILRDAETATFPTSHTVPVILSPADAGQVQECVRIANAHQVPIYPVSSGKNWGYGSRAPSANDCALLDLSRMNHILDFNEDLAYVTVEPGVTQRQLYAFLQERQSRLWMDATGSSPDCSLVGNAMERGFGHTPYGDHASYVCGLEVVLANGDRIETGFAGFPQSQVGQLNRWGVGPSLDGLFSQSNFGIVTRMTIWLLPAPEYFQAFFFRCDEDGSLGPLIEALRPLRLNGTLRSNIHIGNDYKVMAGITQYPWEDTGGQTPLLPLHMTALRKKMKFGYWNGSGGLYGTPAQVAEARRLLRRALRGKVTKLQFLDRRLFGIASRFAKPFGWLTGFDLSRTLELARPVFELIQGIPTDKTLGSVYWRKRYPVPAKPDPNRDGCGLLWCAPVVPAEGGHAALLCEIVTSALTRYGFEPMISITMATERSLAFVISLTYDRDIGGEDDRAIACHSELLQELIANGYPPYRLGLQSMEIMNQSTSAALLKTLKAAIDPNGILAPGRYEAARIRAATVH
jgi:4-cresol dehydrogenase (hydroxylating) flavoprotein subunit